MTTKRYIFMLASIEDGFDNNDLIKMFDSLDERLFVIDFNFTGDRSTALLIAYGHAFNEGFTKDYSTSSLYDWNDPIIQKGLKLRLAKSIIEE